MAAALKLVADKVYELPLGKIEPDPNQPRTDFEKQPLGDLADSIKARGGVIEPILVRVVDGKIIIHNGERRWRASKLANRKTIRAILAPNSTDQDRLLEQIAVNNHHEKLKPMELARALAKIRDEKALKPAAIAKELEAQGFKNMGRSQISNLLRLTELPDWAQGMLNEGKIEFGAARSILAGKDSPAVMKQLQQRITDLIEHDEKVTIDQVEYDVRDAYSEEHHDLTLQYGTCAVHFDYKKICAKCEFLKTVNKTPYCLNDKLFAAHNDAAKAEGLGPLGKKQKTGAKSKADRPSPATPKQSAKEKAASRREQLEGHTRNYLHRWLIARIRKHIEHTDTSRIGAMPFLLFVALGQPGVQSWELGRYGDGARARVHKIAIRHKIKSIGAILASNAAADEWQQVYRELAQSIVGDMHWPQIQAIAHHFFGPRIEVVWKLDGDFLDLHRKNELADMAKICVGASDGKPYDNRKAGDLKALILEKATDMAPPHTLSAVYADVDKDLEEDPEEFLDDVAACIRCGCTEDSPCKGGCAWVLTNDGTDLCSACVTDKDKLEDDGTAIEPESTAEDEDDEA